MEDMHFDRIAKSLAKGRSRRKVLTGGAAALLAAVGLRRGAAAARVWSEQACGGVAGLPCPDGYACFIDPDDPDCKADCLGVCVRVVPPNLCAALLCAAGTTCCPNCGGICVPTGVPCSDELCTGEPCGPNTCGSGEYCCNESCGICAPIGGACGQQYCGEPCGNTVCGSGKYCCNPLTSICLPPDAVCGQ